MYFFRVSVAAILDVLESRFNATSSDIGLMVGLFWMGYSITQIPIGILLQFISAEFVTFIAALFCCITIPLFGLNKTNINYAYVIFLIMGFAASPIYLCFIKTAAVRLGNNAIPFYAGIVVTGCAVGAACSRYVQSYLYDQHGIISETYYVLGGTMTLFYIGFIIFIRIESNNRRTSVSSQKSTNTIEYTNTMSTDLELEFNEDSNDTSSIKMKNVNRQSLICTSLKTAISNPWTYLIGIHFFCSFFFVTTFNGLYQINYFMTKFNWSREKASLINNAFWISHAIFGIVTGRLASKFKRRKIFYIICSVLMFPSIYIVYCESDSSYWYSSQYIIVICNVMIGIGATIIALPFVFVREYNDSLGCSDVSTSIVSTLGTASGFVMPYLVGALMDLHFDARNSKDNTLEDGIKYNESDFNYAFIVVPIICCMNFVIALTLKETNANKIVYKKNANGRLNWCKITAEN